MIYLLWDLLGGSDGKESACNVGDLGLIPGLGKSPGRRHSNLLQYSYWENSMDRGAWRTIAQGDAKSQLTGKDPDAGKD